VKQKFHAMRFTHIETEVAPEIDLDALLKEHSEIIIHNDDHNTFDFVIESLVQVCEHTLIQAEQCTHIIHHNGKCGVKRGEFEILQPMCTALLDRGLSAEIR